jgi:hypothetical protein
MVDRHRVFAAHFGNIQSMRPQIRRAFCPTRTNIRVRRPRSAPTKAGVVAARYGAVNHLSLAW